MNSEDPVLSIHYVADNGDPLEPAQNRRKLISQAGVLGRDMVPISCAEWHKPKDKNDETSYVPDHMKGLLLDTLFKHFSFPENLTEARKEKLKEWTLRKMAIAFQS